ncbi:MAG TPA: porin family protein [Sphingobacteriaceae bacterium]
MKKQFLVLAFMSLPFWGTAQEQPEKLQLGFTVSPNVGWLQITNNTVPGMVSEAPRIGLSYGVLADVGFQKNYFFSTAFVISTLNGRSSLSTPGPGSDNSQFTYKVRAIEVPVTLKLKSNDFSGRRFYGQFGLGAGVRLDARQDFTRSNATGTTFGENINITDQVNTFRLSLIAGGGVEWKVGPDVDILTGITLNNGFTNTMDGDEQLRNSYVALSLGIFF